MRLLFILTICWFSSSLISQQLIHNPSANTVDCSISLLDDGGLGNYSDNYNQGMLLVFPIYVTGVKIEFNVFDLGASNQDTLFIFSGAPIPPNLISFHVGNTIPADVVVANDSLNIVFRTNASNNNTGFDLKMTGYFDGASATKMNDATCYDGKGGAIMFSGNGGAPPYQFSDNNGIGFLGSIPAQGGSFFWTYVNPNSVGTVFPYFEDANTCIDTVGTPITIVNTATPFIFDSVLVTDLPCFGSINSGEVYVEISGSQGGNYDFNWDLGGQIDEGAAVSTYSSLNAGTVTLTISDELDSTCRLDTAFIVEEPSALTFTAAIQDSISCNNECDGTILVNAIGGTPPYEYSSDSGTNYDASSLLDSLCAGSIGIRIRDNNNCVSTLSSVNLVDPLILVVGSVSSDPSGFGLTDGSITANALGGTTPYNYSWNTTPLTTTSILTGVGAGIYIVTVTDAHGCEVSWPDTLFQADTLKAGAIRFAGGGTVQNVCTGGNSTLLSDSISVSGGISPTITWQESSNFVTWTDLPGPHGANHPAITASGITFIRRKVEDGQQTAYSNIIILDEFAPVNAAITGINSPYCQNDDSVTYIGSPVSTQSYFTYVGNQQTLGDSTLTVVFDTLSTAPTSQAISYTYVDLLSGCTSTINENIDINDTADIALEFNSSEYLVSDSTLSLIDQLSNPLGGVNYNFQGPGASGDSLYFNIAGIGEHIYSFTYTNANGCTTNSKDTIAVVESTEINGLGDFKFCVTEGSIYIEAIYPSAELYPQANSSVNMRYRFRLEDYDLNTQIGTTGLYGADAWHTMANPGDSIARDSILLPNLALTTGQFIDTFVVLFQYEKVNVNVTFISQPFPFPPIPVTNFSTSYQWISKEIFVEHIDTIGGFSNLNSPYCDNVGQSNIIIQDQSPIGGTHFWDITDNFTNDGLTGVNLSGVTFDPGIFQGNRNTAYNLEYILTSPLGTCSESMNAVIQVDSIPTLSLSAYPANLCLGEIFTLEGFVSGNPGGTFIGNNIVDLTSGDGLAELNTNLTGPSNLEPITFMYEDLNGCQVDSTWLFTVNDTPSVAVTALNEICFGSNETFIGSQPSGLFYLGPGITDTTTGNSVVFDASILTPDSLYQYSYIDTNTFGCIGRVNSSIYVHDLPTVGISVDGTEFCSNETGIGVNLLPNPEAGDDIFYDGQSQAINMANYYPLDANVLDTGQVIVEYTHTDDNGCSNYATDTIRIYPTPTAQFSYASTCIADTIHFINTSIINGATIDSIIWKFTDNLGQAVSNSQDTSVLFAYPGTRTIELTLISSAGCFDVATDNQYFGAEPRLDFSWDNECMLNPNGTNINFTDLTPVIDGVDSVYWTFGDATVAPGTDTSTTFNPSWVYTTIGQKLITFYGSNPSGCERTITKTLWVRPYVQTYPYTIDFTNGSGGWIPDTVGLGDTISSWAIGIPDTTGAFAPLSPGNFALTTAPNDNYYNDEYSSVVSPCFDFSLLDRPMIKVHYALETDDNDGLNINYQDTAGVWQALGATGEGINWYDGYTDGLNEAQIPYNHGWYENTNDWVDARLRLDPIVGDTNVQFQVVFGSNSGLTNKGAAIDYIWIGERQRTVLSEHFTNYNHLDAIQTNIYDTVVEKPELNRNGLDIISLEYHTSTEPNELINLNYQPGPAARLNYYGLDTVPYVITDGISYRGTVLDWYTNLNLLESRTLQDPQFDIRLNITQNNYDFSVSADFEATMDLGNTNITVRMAIVEDSIDVNSRIHRNTVIDFLPEASGRSFSNPDWLAGPGWPWLGAGQVYNVTETKAITTNMMTNPNLLDVVVWIQDNDTEEVYQAVSGKITSLLGLEGVHEKSAPMDFILFPNPTNGSSSIVLNNSFDEKGQVWVHDASGRLIEQIEIDKFQESIALRNTDYKNGMYFVSVISPNGQKMTKKMVVQKN